MSGFSVRLTHKVMAIGIVGLTGLLAFAAIYQAGSWSQDASRTVAKTAQGIADLNKQLSIEMLEARRNEKNFQQRRNESGATGTRPPRRLRRRRGARRLAGARRHGERELYLEKRNAPGARVLRRR